MFILSRLFILLTLSLAIGAAAPSFAQSKIKVQTKWDLFELDKQGTGYSLGGKMVESTHLNPLLKMLATPATAPCEGAFTPEVSVTAITNGQTKESKISLSKGILKGPEGCLLISGPGLDGFPLHRSWLIGPFQRTVQILKTVSFQGGGVQFTAEFQEGDWELTQPQNKFSYEFLDQFLRSFNGFKVDRFISIAAAEGKPKVEMKVDGAQILLYQLAPTTWAMKDAGKPWLMVSPNWSNWKNLDQAQWTDSYATEIETLLSAQSSSEHKKATLDTLGSAWSESLKRAFQKCLLDDQNSNSLRLECLSKMRRRPTPSNTKTVIKLLDATEDAQLLREAGDFLRLQNPKGPKFTAENSEKFKREWKAWWAKSKR